MELHAPTHRLLAQLILLYVLGFTDILPSLSILVCGALHSALYSRLPGFVRRSDHHLELLCVEDVNISALEDIDTQGNFSVFECCFSNLDLLHVFKNCHKIQIACKSFLPIECVRSCDQKPYLHNERKGGILKK